MTRFTSMVVFAKQPVVASDSAEVGTNDHEVAIVECLLNDRATPLLESESSPRAAAA